MAKKSFLSKRLSLPQNVKRDENGLSKKAIVFGTKISFVRSNFPTSLECRQKKRLPIKGLKIAVMFVSHFPEILGTHLQVLPELHNAANVAIITKSEALSEAPFLSPVIPSFGTGPSESSGTAFSAKDLRIWGG